MGKLKGLKVVSLLTLMSRVTGLARDSLMASLFGAGWVFDAFTVAFRIPNMFRRLFGEGAMTAAFLPEFVRTEQQYGRAAASELFQVVARRLFRLLLSLTLLIEFGIAVSWLCLPLSERNLLLCELSLIMMPYMLLICMAGLYAAALNGVQHFVVPAVTPVVLNVVWLLGGLAIAQMVTDDQFRMLLIAITIVIGGCLQLGMTMIQAARFRISAFGGKAEVVQEFDAERQTDRVFYLMGSVLLGLSVSQINGLVDSAVAWALVSNRLDDAGWLHHFRLPEGVAGALYLGQRLFQFPMGVFAVALGTVLFPRFARHIQSGDLPELGREILHGLQLVMVAGIPASVGLWFMAAPVTDLLFRYGQFDEQATIMTHQMVAGYALGVWVFSAMLIINRVFYAANDQVTPMRQGLVCVGLNLILDVVLVPLLDGSALPIATVLATTVQLGMALYCLFRRYPSIPLKALIPMLWRVGLCTLLMYGAGCRALELVAAYSGDFSDMGFRVVRVVVPITVSVVVYTVAMMGTGVSFRRLLDVPLMFRE